MTTTWRIYNLERQIADGLVVKVFYGCVVTSGDVLNRATGNLELTGDISDPGFIPFENLTEATVIGWVQTELGTEEVTNIETNLQASVQSTLDAEAAKTTEDGLPW